MSMRNELAVIADPAYLEFQAKLVPTVAPERILGVRTPELRRLPARSGRTGLRRRRLFYMNPSPMKPMTR